MPLARASSRSSSRPLRSPSMMRCDEALLDRPVRPVLLLDRLHLHVGEELEQLLQRVVLVVTVGERAGRAAAVPHEVHADVALLVGDPVEREDLRGVDDGRVQAGLHALVQEDRVEDVAGGRLQAERHVGEAEHGVGAGDLGLDAADGLHRLDGVAAEVVVAGRQREGERVEDEVGRFEAVGVHREVGDAVGHPHLPLDVAGLALLVDEQADHRRAVGLGQREDAVEPGAGRVAVLEVGRVEDGAAADPLEAGLHHLGLGGVEHERRVDAGGEPAGDLVHVDGAVATDVVDAHVEDVRAFLHLVGGHLRGGVPVAFEERLAERLRAVGVGPLADHQERRVLLERDGGVDRRGRRLVHRGAGRGGEVLHRVGEETDVVGCGAAAPADHLHAQLGDEAGLVLGQLLGREVVVHLAVDHRRHAGVGQAGDRHARVLREVAQVLAHLVGTGGAVDADDVDAQRVDGRQRGADLGARQHPAGDLDGDLRLDGQVDPGGRHGLAAADHRGLEAEEVELGLDEQHVDAAALEQPGHLHLVGVAQVGEADLLQRGELRAGADRAGHHAAVPARDLAGDAAPLPR